jgi:hypothetical protein
MATKGLLFIPDISGFSRFVNETEVEHSRMIIQELLETIIAANSIGLEISEIEGDAILFYKFGSLPGLTELYRQVEAMFCAFHRNISAYALRRYCQCRACVAATDLSLKVITHAGEFTGYNVNRFNTLIGRDLIIAHELLKNEIGHHEYWLVTQSVLQDCPPDVLTESMPWNRGAQQTRGGEISFQYTELSPLRSAVAPEPLPRGVLASKVRVISAAREYDTDIITLFHASGDFNYRSHWLEGVTRVEEVDHLLPRVGMRCRCILENGETYTYSSSCNFHSDRIEFSETDEAKSTVTCFTLEKLDERRTRLTLDYYVPRNFAAEIAFRLGRKARVERMFERSLDNLVAVVNEIHLPDRGNELDP